MPTVNISVPEPGSASEYWRRSRPFGVADGATNTVELIELRPVPGGSGLLVLELVLVTSVAFSGGTVAVNLGDGDSATTWATGLAPTAVGVLRSFGPGSNGKNYLTKQRLIASLNAGLVAGQAVLWARCIDLP